jgi:hypothetical protein
VRGALLNTQDLQFIYLTRYAAAQAAQLLGSDVDPEALAKVAFVDNGVAELVTHPYVQHVLGIDSAGGVLGGYAIGFGLAFIFGDIFQTKRKKVPMFDEGNDVSLAFRTMLGKPWHNTLVDNLDNDDYAGAADVMFEGLTSLNISHYISGAPSAAGLTDEDIANLTGTRRQIEPQKLVAYRKRLLELAASADAELESVRLDTAVNPQDQLKAIGEGKFRSSIRIFNYADSVFERAVDYAQAFANGSSPSAEEVRMLVIDLAMLKTLVNSPGTANVKWYLKDVADNLDTLIQNVPDMTYDHTAASFASSLNRGAVNTNSFGPIPIIPEDGSAVLDARPVFMDK